MSDLTARIHINDEEFERVIAAVLGRFQKAAVLEAIQTSAYQNVIRGDDAEALAEWIVKRLATRPVGEIGVDGR